MNTPSIDTIPTLSRRALMGMGGLALADMLTRKARANSLHEPHFPARAKRMIFILLQASALP